MCFSGGAQHADSNRGSGGAGGLRVPSRTLRGVAAACLVILACASGFERVQTSDSRLVELACARANPTMQTAALEALVAGGGPLSADVAGWMCGRMTYGYVRIVMLRYTPDNPKKPRFLVPVLFEQGDPVALGWHLLETQPTRYGPSPLPDRDHPWRVPDGWSCIRYRGE